MDHGLLPAASAAQGQPSADDLWRKPMAHLLTRLDTTKAGLDAAAARSRLVLYGFNNATAEMKRPLLLQFLARFRNPLIIILLIASGMSGATGDTPSFVIIAVIVLLSISLDFVQEVRAQSAVEALRRSVAVQVTVPRDGRAISLPIDQLVPGDIAELIAGDLVPADCRLLESRDLYVNQALLTGEPYPAEKLVSDIASGAENPTGASNAVFAGTSVISGTAVILVCRTGAQTALGHLATSLAEKPPATAFAVGIRRFGRVIIRFTIFMVMFVLVVNLSFHRSLLESVMFAVALAVGLTPELLPMIVTVTLARSALQFSKRRVIVKRLSAIHDLALQLMAHDALGPHARDELGLSEELRARPIQAALTSAASFSAGAIVPLVVSVFTPSAALMLVVAGTSLLFLALLGLWPPASAARSWPPPRSESCSGVHSQWVLQPASALFSARWFKACGRPLPNLFECSSSQARPSFLKEKSERLYVAVAVLSGSVRPRRRSFLVLFFKRELLALPMRGSTQIDLVSVHQGLA